MEDFWINSILDESIIIFSSLGYYYFAVLVIWYKKKIFFFFIFFVAKKYKWNKKNDLKKLNKQGSFLHWLSIFLIPLK